MAGKNSGCTLALLGAFSFPFLALGLFLGLISAPQSGREARDIQQMPELNAATFRACADQTPVALNGVLTGNAVQANWEGFVIYLEQEWVVTEEEDGWDGSWETRRTIVPDLKLIFADAEIIVYANPEVKLGGAWRETILHRPENQEEVDGFPAGSIRRVGFMDGDRITLVGVKHDAEGVTPKRFYGGERADLIRTLRQSALVQRVLGGIFGLAGVIILVVSLRDRFTKG